MPVYRFVTATEIAKTQRPVLHGRNMAGVIESKTRKKATKFAIGTRGYVGSIRYDLATQVRDLGSLQLVHPGPTLVYNSQIDWGAVRKEHS